MTSRQCSFTVVPITSKDVSSSARSASIGSVITAVMWPLAIMSVIHRTFILGVNGNRNTNDFFPVYVAARRFLDSQTVYAENLNTVDPHYLYPPSGTLLMAPIAALPLEESRRVFFVISAIAIVAGLYLLAKLFGFSVRGPAFPIIIFAAFLTETVTNTLVFTNFNGFMFFCEAAFLILLMKRKGLWAGLFLGVTLAIKPLLVVLLLLVLLARQWKVFVTAIGLPLVVMAVATPLSVDPGNFLRRTVPYLLRPRDYANRSIQGTFMYFGVDSWLAWVCRLALGVMALISLYLLYRYYYRTQPLLWLCTSSGILLTCVFVVGSLGQGYYSMLLFPMLMTVTLRNSVVRNWPFWLGVYLCMTLDTWLSLAWPALGKTVDYWRVTIGWSLIIIVPFCVLVYRYLDAKKRGTADSSIDRVQDHSAHCDPVVADPVTS